MRSNDFLVVVSSLPRLMLACHVSIVCSASRLVVASKFLSPRRKLSFPTCLSNECTFIHSPRGIDVQANKWPGWTQSPKDPDRVLLAETIRKLITCRMRFGVGFGKDTPFRIDAFLSLVQQGEKGKEIDL